MPINFNTHKNDSGGGYERYEQQSGAAAVLGRTKVGSGSGGGGGNGKANGKNAKRAAPGGSGSSTNSGVAAHRPSEKNDNDEGSPILVPNTNKQQRAAHAPRNRAGMAVPANGVYRFFSFAVALVTGAGGGFLTSVALDYKAGFVLVGVGITALIAYLETLFWVHFHDKSILDVIKMALTGGLGFAGYLTIATVIVSIAFNATGLHKINTFNKWDWNDWHTEFDVLMGAVISVTPGTMLHYAFTGKFWGS